MGNGEGKGINGVYKGIVVTNATALTNMGRIALRGFCGRNHIGAVVVTRGGDKILRLTETAIGTGIDGATLLGTGGGTDRGGQIFVLAVANVSIEEDLVITGACVIDTAEKGTCT